MNCRADQLRGRADHGHAGARQEPALQPKATSTPTTPSWCRRSRPTSSLARGAQGQDHLAQPWLGLRQVGAGERREVRLQGRVFRHQRRRGAGTDLRAAPTRTCRATPWPRTRRSKRTARSSSRTLTVDEGLVWGAAFRKDDAKLRNAVDEAIECLKMKGTLAQLYEKWFGVKPPAGSATVTVYPGLRRAGHGRLRRRPSTRPTASSR